MALMKMIFMHGATLCAVGRLQMAPCNAFIAYHFSSVSHFYASRFNVAFIESWKQIANQLSYGNSFAQNRQQMIVFGASAVKWNNNSSQTKEFIENTIGRTTCIFSAIHMRYNDLFLWRRWPCVFTAHCAFKCIYTFGSFIVFRTYIYKFIG